MGTSHAPQPNAALPPPFSACLHQVGDDIVHVLVTGDVDFLTRDQLADAIDRASLTRPTTVIVDLTEVTFLSASGAAVLTQARTVARARGVTLSIRSRPGIVRWVVSFVERPRPPVHP